MTTPNQLLRQLHVEAQDAVEAYWDILVFIDTRLERPHIIQVRQKREARIIQSYCFDTASSAGMFLKAIHSNAVGGLVPEGFNADSLVQCPEGYTFKEAEPPRRSRRVTKPGETDEPKPKRRRRTQAEIAADLQAASRS